MFIETEPTPNPNTLKFLPGRTVLPQGTVLTSAAEAVPGTASAAEPARAKAAAPT